MSKHTSSLNRRLLNALLMGCGLATLAVPSISRAAPLSNSFTYQGTLSAFGAPAEGTYDLRFRLMTDANAGTQIGTTLCINDIQITAGQFTVVLDFGSVFPGETRFLDIDVRPDTDLLLACVDEASWQTLAPRQEISPTPYALHSLSAASAATATTADTANTATLATQATTATTATNAANLNGQPASFYLSASNLTSGTLPSARLSGTYGSTVSFLNNSNFFLGSFTGSFTGNGLSISQLDANSLTTGTLPDARLSGTYTSALTLSNASNAISGIFTGNGAALTNISASNLASGTLPDARLSGTYASALTLSNASNAITGVFTGNGAALTTLNASNLASGTLPSARLSGTYSSALTLSNASNAITGIFTGNGAALTTLNATNIASGTLADARLSSNIPRLNTANAFGNFSNTFAGFVGIGMTAPSFPLHIEGATGIAVGNSATGRTRIMMQISQDSNGYGILQAISAQGTSWGDIIMNSLGGRVGIATTVLSDSSLHVSAANRSAAITGQSAVNGGIAIVGESTSATGNSVGGIFYVASTAGTALEGIAESATGVTYGVKGTTQSASTNAMGVRGEATASGANFGVYGMATGATSFGVYANGRLGASGTKSFMIDHPLDPENKYLYHYSLESPDVLNVYTGTVELDESGEAWVMLPDYFESINTNPRYLLTSIGAPAPMLHIAVEVTANRFKVAGGSPNTKVSWELKAQRNDRFVKTYGAPVERIKQAGEQGTYLRPELYSKPAESSQFARPAASQPIADSASN